ncbi:VWA domain-containing protein [Bacillus swezeyi]|uniref:VWA domain-containing protein n=1 Tax=Bacillus swezeyi TaxID=1925020 RepID=A0A5M8RT69_9BACI|nr:VWA domain-containing protein [Bacillus swezeyi]KAA6451011.1 VWA domain-containing protein [Bacillus swezeyi]TYS37481.1 VWA domain-containing protein [Bacillus swezeyi]
MRKKLTLGIMTAMVLSLGSPAFAAEKKQEVTVAEDAPNIAIMLDASGSMAKKMNGVSKYELAKNEAFSFGSKLENTNVLMRVFGSEGNNKNSGKVQSCNAIRGVYGFQTYDEQSFRNSLNGIGPTGWTPIANALQDAKNAFDQLNSNGKNIVYLLTDGEETCGGNPVKVATELRKSDRDTVVNVIGFDYEGDFHGQLTSIAKAGGGEYFQAKTKNDIKKIFTQEAIELSK